MQAHPQSIPAALIPFQSPLSPQPATPTQPTLELRRLPASVSRPAIPSPSIPHPAASGIAQSKGLAHDAGNLLGALGLYCDLLRSPGVLRPEHIHYATELGLISSRSSELIRRLLALSPSADLPSAPSEAIPSALRLQPSSVRRGTTRLPQDPAVTHASVLHHLSPVLQRIAAGVATVSVFSPASLPPLDLSIEALERIAVNLVRNAVEAIRKQQEDRPAGTPRTHGEIRVALAIVSGRLQLIVEDNGPGVPPPVAAAFLSPGHLPPNSHRGLGHRIVHELVTASGGQISIRSRPSLGTLFCMKWPLRLHTGVSPSIDTPTAVISGQPSIPTPQEGLASC